MFCCVLSGFYYHPWLLLSLFQQSLILDRFLLKPFQRSVLIEITKITYRIHPPGHLRNHLFNPPPHHLFIHPMVPRIYYGTQML